MSSVEGKKGSSKGLIAGLVVLVLTAVGGAAAYFVWFTGPSSKLSASVPGDVELFVEMTSLHDTVKAARDIAWLDLSKIDHEVGVDKAKEALEEGFDLDGDDAEALVGSLVGSAFAARDLGKDEGEATLLLSFTDAGPVEALLGSDRFEDDGEVAGGTRYLLEKGEDADEPFASMEFEEDEDDILVWFPDAKTLVVGDEKMVEDVGAVLAGDQDALATTDAWKQAEAGSGHGIVWMSGDAIEELAEDGSKGVKDVLEDAGALTGSIDIVPSGLLMDIAVDLSAAELEALPEDMPAIELPRRLPRETVYYNATAVPAMAGKDFQKLLLEYAEKGDERTAEKLEKVLDELEDVAGFDLPELMDALGDQVVFAVAVEDGFAFDPDDEPKEMIEDAAFAIVATVGDEDDAKEVLEALREKVFEQAPFEKIYDVDEEDDGFDADPIDEAEDKGFPPVRVRIEDGRMLVTAGGLADRFVEAVFEGKDTLADETAHEKSISALKRKPWFLTWLDAGRVGKLGLDAAEDRMPEVEERIDELEDETGLELEAFRLEGDQRMTGVMAIGAERKGDRVIAHFEMLNLPGIVPALGIFGVRRYLASSKTSEAKNTVGAISRGAVAAYEREVVDPEGTETTHELCQSAKAVPATVPLGRKYQPSTSPGSDYQAGDSTTGWKCLKFALTQPQYYQYQYVRGGPYKGPKRGGPDPGPDGFEVSAEGDLDGDGKTSLFTRTGKIVNGRVRVAPQLFIDDELE